MNNLNDVILKLLEGSIGYLWFILLALWGGTVNYLSRLKQDEHAHFSMVELVGEWSISGFAGLLTAYICVEFELSWTMTAFFTGISGHLGGRAIYMLEVNVKRHFRNIQGLGPDDKDNGSPSV